MSRRKYFNDLLKPLVARQPRLVKRPNALIVLPVRHVLRAVAVESTLRGSGFTISTELRMTAASGFKGYFGELMRKSGYIPKHHFWQWNEDGLPNTALEAIERESLPLLMPLDDLDSAYRAFLDQIDPSQGGYHSCLYYYLLAFGQFEQAWPLINRQSGWFGTRELIELRFGELYPMLYERGDRLTRDEKRRVIASLHAQEERVIKEFKLEKYWQPSPFPAEEQELV